MSHRRNLTKTQDRILSMVTAGYPISTIARTLRVSPQKVNTVITKLISMGKLRLLNTNNEITFGKTEHSPALTHENEECARTHAPTRDYKDGEESDGAYVEDCGDVPKSEQTKVNRQLVKKYILERRSVDEIANRLNKHPNSIRNILNSMVERGELVRVPNSNPAFYVDPLVSMDPVEPDDTILKRSDLDPIFDTYDKSRSLPLGYVNRHLNGHIAFKTIRAKGDMNPVPSVEDKRIIVGKWGPKKSGGNGKSRWDCEFQLFGQSLTVSYYLSTHGVEEFRVFPGRIYCNPEKVNLQRCKDYLIERALYIAGLLKQNGWQVSDPELRGTIHTARENDPLARFIPRDTDDDNEIIVDTSHGITETEIEDMTDEEQTKFYSNLPGKFADMSSRLEDQESRLEVMTDRIIQLLDYIQLQSEAVTALSQNVTELSEVSSNLTSMQMGGRTVHV